MINGSFGVGKTTIAEMLLTTIPKALLFDPEMVGYLVHEITKDMRAADEETADFQDISIWRPLVISTAEQLSRRYSRPLVVPMTIANPEYLDEITNGFRAFDPQLYHFCLTASLQTVHHRLRNRGVKEGVWCWNKAIEYAPLFHTPRYATHIDTENRAPTEVTFEIMSHLSRYQNAV